MFGEIPPRGGMWHPGSWIWASLTQCVFPSLPSSPVRQDATMQDRDASKEWCENLILDDLKSLGVGSLGNVIFPRLVQKLLLLITRLDLQDKGGKLHLKIAYAEDYWLWSAAAAGQVLTRTPSTSLYMCSSLPISFLFCCSRMLLCSWPTLTAVSPEILQMEIRALASGLMGLTPSKPSSLLISCHTSPTCSTATHTHSPYSKVFMFWL